MDTVKFYDIESGQITIIRAASLPFGAVRAEVRGIDGIVWVLPAKLQPGPFQHAQFSEPVRDFIRYIQSAFAEHMPLSFIEWEDGFRRDRTPESEIATWVHAANVYTDFVGQRQWSAAERADAYRVIVACMNASQDLVWQTVSLSVLSRPQLETVVSRFYGKK
jgi:hypothetical protein